MPVKNTDKLLTLKKTDRKIKILTNTARRRSVYDNVI